MSNIADDTTSNMDKDEEMLVTKRDGSKEVIAFDKILKKSEH